MWLALQKSMKKILMILLSSLTITHFVSANEDLKPLSAEQIENLLKPFVSGDRANNYVVIQVLNPSDAATQFALREPPTFIIVARLEAVAPIIGLQGALDLKFKEFSDELAQNVIRSVNQRTAKIMNTSIEKLSNLMGVYQGPRRGIVVGSGEYAKYKATNILPLSDFAN